MPDLSLQITKYLSQYTKDVQEVLEKVTDETTKQATDKLKQLSPKRTLKAGQGKEVNPVISFIIDGIILRTY